MSECLTKRLERLFNFLHPYKEIWSKEVLNSFPDTITHYPLEWITELESKTDHELWEIDSHTSFESIKNKSLHDFCTSARTLGDIKKKEIIPLSFPHWAYINVKGKKKHELDHFSSLITDLNTRFNFKSMTNIGGGMGHLSRMIAHYQRIPCIDIDMDKTLQELGTKRLEKYPMPEGASPVIFVNSFIDENSHLSNINHYFSCDGITTGLHTCGALAVRHIELAINNKVKGLINFGCCYAKMTNNDYNLSNESKKYSLDLPNHALTLATRAHSAISFADYKFKVKVKYYRYALHILLYKKLNILEFITVGNGHRSHYDGTFSEYAIAMMKRVGINHSLSNLEIDEFYNDKAIQKIIKKLFLMNIIRWQLGRAIEVYILTDRAIFMEENGYDVELLQVFDEIISPRNIALIAIKKI